MLSLIDVQINLTEMDENEILDDFSYESESVEDKHLTKVEIISVNKFILLFLASLGLYGVWWMYKSWKFFKEKEMLDIMPVARAIFSVFYAYGLFEKILTSALSSGYKKTYSSGGLFALFIIINLTSRLPDPFWMISLLGFLPLIQPHQALNFVIENSENYHAVERRGFNGKQIALLIIGGLFWILIILGTLFVEDF